MNENEKTFYVKKIEKYESDLSKANRIETLSIIMLGLSVLGFIVSAKWVQHDPSWQEKVQSILMVILLSGFSFWGIKLLIISIIEQAGLRNRIMEIEEAIELFEVGNDFENSCKKI